MMQIPLHLSTTFIALVFAMAFIILIGVYFAGNRLNLPSAKVSTNLWLSIGVILSWFVLVFIISVIVPDTKAGLAGQLLLIVSVPMLVVTYLIFSPGFNRLANQIDTHWFIYLQSYRLLREFILLMLFRYQCIPQSYTLYGTNFDILIGLSAPFVAYYCVYNRKHALLLTIVWNVLGLTSITNVLIKTLSALTTPNGLQSAFVVEFPFIWLPAFLIPLGTLMHLIVLKRTLFVKPTAFT